MDTEMMAFLSHKCGWILEYTLDVFPKWIDNPLPVTRRRGLRPDIKIEHISPVSIPLSSNGALCPSVKGTTNTALQSQNKNLRSLESSKHSARKEKATGKLWPTQ